MPDQPAPSVSSPAWHSGSAWSPLICREIRRIWRRRSADLSCGMTATICLHMTTYYVCIVNYDYICFYLYAHKVVKICPCTYTCLSRILFLLLWLFTIPEVLKCYWYAHCSTAILWVSINYIYIHYLYAHSSPVPSEAASPRQPRSPCPARIAPHSIPMSPKSNTAMHKLTETTTPMQPMHVLLS